MANCLRRIFTSRQIATVIDVGANRGQFRRFLRDQVEFDGRIVSFEPVSELAASLRAQARSDGKWLVRDCALGATVGESTLNIMASSVFSSFLEPLPGPSFDAGNTVARTERVAVSTLDAEFPDPAVLRTAYLKLDTQGFDLEVMKGGRLASRFIPALQTEVSFQPVYEKMPDYVQALAEFGRYGFTVSDMFLVNPNDAGVAIEFDCIMVRDGVAGSAP